MPAYKKAALKSRVSILAKSEEVLSPLRRGVLVFQVGLQRQTGARRCRVASTQQTKKGGL